MPHSIFFTKIGHAIHGTDSAGRLGSPASHGCVRLSRANAATLYALVQEQGVLNTTVTLTGSSQVALARNPRGAPTPRWPAAHRPADEQQQYDNAGDPVVITPQRLAPAPQRKPAPMTAISIRPMAAPTSSAIRRRAADAPTQRRCLSASSSILLLWRRGYARLRAAGLLPAAAVLPAAAAFHLPGLRSSSRAIARRRAAAARPRRACWNNRRSRPAAVPSASVIAQLSDDASLPTSASSRAETTTVVEKMYSLSRPESSL